MVFSIKIGGVNMADIFEFVKKSDNRRPVYTSYELSKMGRDKRQELGIDALEFSAEHGISTNDLQRIEEGTCSFSPKLYRVCGKILGLSSEELLEEIEDDISAANFRADGDAETIKETFGIANMLFNEMIMQRKIGAK